MLYCLSGQRVRALDLYGGVVGLRSWQDRANTLGLLPGRLSDQLLVLEEVAKQLPAPDSARLTITSSKSKSARTTVDDICSKQLSRTGLVERGADGNWTPTSVLSEWLTNREPIQLAKAIHQHVKFFGELMHELDQHTSSTALLRAAKKYGLVWTSKDQVDRRVAWLKSLGFVEQWSVTAPLVSTDAGRKFLTSVELCTPEEAANVQSVPDEPASLPEPDPAITEALEGLNEISLRNRRPLIGYIPKGKKVHREETSGSTFVSPLESIRRIVGLIDRSGTATDDLFVRASAEFGLKKTSFDQTIHTVRHMGFIELVSFNTYAPTEQAEELLQAGREIDLIRYLHCRYAFVGELLVHLSGPISASSLVANAQHEYGFKQIDNSEIRTRLGFLSDANLVERVDWTRYKPTASGLALANELPVQGPNRGSVASGESESHADVEDAPAATGQTTSISEELRKYSRAGELNVEFEAAVRRAFEFLGFDAEHLGGKGRTDVLLTAVLGPNASYTAIVDAKAASSGTVAEGQVNFNALRDHKKKHEATFGVLVGWEFAKRIIDWAPENEFGLITVEELVRILELHDGAPMTLPQLRQLFVPEEGAVDATIAALEKLSEHRVIISRLLDLLYEEAADSDPVAGGFMTRENLQYIIRKEFKPRPQKMTIDACLAMLESDLVRGVEREAGRNADDRFRLADSPLNVRLRLARLGADVSIPAISDEDV